MLTTGAVMPGDVLCVRSPGWRARLIRTAAALTGRPELDNHIAIVHHADENGVLWAIEGRPGGVGWRDAADYLRSPYTITNIGQAKDPDQRRIITAGARALLGEPYDWIGIAADAAKCLDLSALFHPAWDSVGAARVPGHVVCSSLAAWCYAEAGLAGPLQGRETTPGDWLAFILNHGFQEAR